MPCVLLVPSGSHHPWVPEPAGEGPGARGQLSGALPWLVARFATPSPP